MNYYNSYIPQEIVNIILENITEYKDKNNFILINKYLYKTYNKKIKFYRLEIYLNNDYIKFYKLLNKYNYEEDIEYLNKILNLSVNNINNIWENDYMGYFDLRYIFELIYKFNDVIKYINIKNISLKYLINILNSCIVKNRCKTIENIEKSILSSLKNDFNPISKKNNIEWIKLI